MCKISVVITTVDRPDLVNRCYDSLLRQEMLPDELIIVVDTSETNFDLSEIQIDNKLSPQIYFNGTQRGANYSRNFGYKTSTSDFVLFCDDDDTFHKSKISELKRVIKETEDPIILNHQYEIFYSDLNFRYRKENLIADKLLLLVHNIVGPTSFVGITRVNNITPFDESMDALQDWDAWINLVWNHNFSLRTVNKELGTYYIQNMKSTSKNLDKFEKSYTRLRCKIKKIIKDRGIKNIRNSDLVSSYYSVKAWKLLHNNRNFLASLYFARSFIFSRFDLNIVMKSIASLLGLRLTFFIKKNLR